MRSDSAAIVLRRAVVRGAETDIRIEGDRIAAIGRGLGREPGEPEIDAAGGAVLPGLHDHHVHLRAAAAAASSVHLGPPTVTDADEFSAALRSAAGQRSVAGQRSAAGLWDAAGESGRGWIRGVGYHDSVAGPLDRLVIDSIVADLPVRIQHRTGSLWILNSAALAALRADQASEPGIERDERGVATGRLWRMDAWLRDRLPVSGVAGEEGGGPARSLAGLSAAALARGVTGWTDATPGRTDQDAIELAAAVADGNIRQRLHLMAPAGLTAEAAERISAVSGVTVGPVKLMLDDWDLPGIDPLTQSIAEAHARGRPVAVHCVTLAQLVLTMTALEAADARTGTFTGDRIEHGAVIPRALLPRLAALHVTVVTQPAFVYARGDQYLTDVSPGDVPDLWRGRSLVDAGVPVAAGTDAPFGPADPWAGVRAATRRTTVSGQVLGAEEAVSPEVAVRWWLGRAASPATPRRIAVGEPADIAVLRAPLAELLRQPGESDETPVAATIVGGRIAHPPELA